MLCLHCMHTPHFGLQVPGLTPPDLEAYTFHNRGAAIECRINAENPSSNYSPSSGEAVGVIIAAKRIWHELDAQSDDSAL